ncbi:low-density lipoprotein receptor class A domain-containing protein 1 isoform X3 [Camelus ferus]|uniref:Low-density lipoprotein receptor class A domain-containing protein 1 isoform X3 n=1 Tax=Camelus ferus TaxID=419612 RepID=A0A8B7K7D3_CAMFR|nr:low-density lipoprotein receptor class A domain-containing protein 1 isoform X3 [Camelus ferus]
MLRARRLDLGAGSWELGARAGGAGDMNKVFPQVDGNGNAAAGTEALPAGEADCSPLCCSHRGAFLSAFLLLLLATLAALIALVAILGPPPRTPGAQACVTLMNRTGFLCHDRRSCVPASRVCDGVRTCAHGEDEEEALCLSTCPLCSPGWWRCPSTVFRYCSCIPRRLCQDHVQHCSDWSDEYSCPGP